VSRTVHLEDGAAKELVSPLEAEPSLIHIVALHGDRGTWAQIFVDGELIDESHAAYRTVSPGTYLVTARREGFREASGRVAVGPGERKKIVLVLEKK
jgi:hypothetical protein